MDIAAFASDVGDVGDVCIEGLASRGGGRSGTNGVRVVSAPTGIVRIEPDEMIVECGAGTPMEVVNEALAQVGQRVCLPDGGTVGGALAVGRCGIRRLGDGHVRDTLLGAHYVDASGELVRIGGQTVKNVSGFDLCRLFVGSRGVLGFFASVILRTRPLPASSTWFRGHLAPERALTGLFRPTSLLWDGQTVWALLEGHPNDVRDQAGTLGLVQADAPHLPTGGRWSLPPADLLSAAPPFGDDEFVAELGVGIVHTRRPAPVVPVDTGVRRLNQRLKSLFDPTHRLNPGVDVMQPLP